MFFKRKISFVFYAYNQWRTYIFLNLLTVGSMIDYDRSVCSVVYSLQINCLTLFY